jgi:hypothetical protein
VLQVAKKPRCGIEEQRRKGRGGFARPEACPPDQASLQQDVAVQRLAATEDTPPTHTRDYAPENRHGCCHALAR